MSAYKPAALPPSFQWEELPESTRVLRCRDQEILRVAPMNRGWVVEVLVPDADGNQPRFVPTSKEAGTWWGAKWAKDRVRYLEWTTNPSTSLELRSR